MADEGVSEPFPISKVAYRYMLYDINTITFVRREHRILGVLIGSLPQAPQQNVFTGLPLELMPEEARLLVEQGHAYIVDDVQTHRGWLGGLSNREKRALLNALEKQGLEAASRSKDKAEGRKAKALEKLDRKPRANAEAINAALEAPAQPEEEGNSIFNPSPAASPASERVAENELRAFGITPATSFTPSTLASIPKLPLPKVPRSYPLFAHLHKHGYYMSPGLRFGCKYNVYPGDALRYHSHFLATGFDWDEEIDLLTLVGGGRLGTGVKKAYLIGGIQGPTGKASDNVPGTEAKVRTFCIEWSGM